MINIRSLLVILPLILLSAYADADLDETKAHLGFTARAIPSVIHVGDQVRFIIQGEIPKGVSLAPISAKTDFSPFQLVSVDKPLVVQKEKTILQTFIVRLTIFRTGDFQIPSIPVTIWNIQSQGALARTSPVPVKVVGIGKTQKDSDTIRPIKGPAAMSLRYLWDWIFGVFLALAVLLLALCVIFRRRREMADLESRLPPHDRAFLELERLNEEHYLAAGRQKEHYTGLSDILRRYLKRRFGLEVMEHTSLEILHILKQRNFEQSVIEDAKVVFDNTDLVKFAMLTPVRALAEEVENRLRQLVERTKLSDERSADGKSAQ